ncbi:cupin domain-containing protein [Actinomycetospora sp. TBRC 11914]|uniref:(R)-mandelonitrile lyase n=1 Tax=Actinomycetospora sp. TBRC 11914 TaxID=2729387 RepID=UPI00145ECCD6|nr:cupin domain-containing protein [Actinomycetospora sp. TBRC 11914]NMO90603.1 cupin domain-containing protein [Actinomycetospora sp. TBRC 11914]
METLPAKSSAKAPAERFTGEVYVDSIYRGQEPSRMIASAVTFIPGARSNWHSHTRGQTLHCTHGIGLVVNRDGTVLTLRPGETVWTPPGEEHWHGATEGNLMCHLALLETDDNGEDTTWLEQVTDEQYRVAHVHT